MTGKRGILGLGVVLATVCLVSLTAAAARAEKPFLEQFKAKYVKADSDKPGDVALREACNKAACGICHVSRQDKKKRNAYGKELGKLLSHKDAMDSQKIQDALDKVAAMKSKAGDPKSPTYGEIIASGKLPAAK
jgi:hypothetical protein